MLATLILKLPLQWLQLRLLPLPNVQLCEYMGTRETVGEVCYEWKGVLIFDHM